MDRGQASGRTGSQWPRHQVNRDLLTFSVVVRGVLCFSGFFNLHIAKLFGVKDLATIQALDKLAVFVPGNDSYPGMLADGCHRFVVVWMNYSFRQIVSVFSVIWNGYLLNFLVSPSVFSVSVQNDSEPDLKSRQKWSYTECGPKKSDIDMLKLTKKADYGLMALKYLAEHPETPALSAKDVADAYGIPAQLLAKILQLLTKNSLLRSHAGMNGGYALARDAREISAYEVIHAIDGPFFITSCTKGKKSCELTPSCTIKEPLARVNETIAGVLKSISIQDLVEHEQPARRAHEAKELVELTL